MKSFEAHTEEQSRPTSWCEVLKPCVAAIRDALHSSSHDTELLRKLLSDCFNTYSDFLNVTSVDETLSTMAGDGCSSLEIAFSWMGRWRPTSAVFLVFSTMGLDGTAKYNGSSETNENSPHRLPLSEKQLSALSALQKHVSRAEADLSQQVASFQMLLAEQNAVTALCLEGTDVAFGNLSNFQELLDVKLKELQTLLVKADNLRLHTVKTLLDLLNPAQAASCCIVAYELLYALRSLCQRASNACVET